MKLIVILVIFCIINVAYSCDVLTEAHHGCKIENSQCLCSFGCKSEFRYRTKKECTDALKGRAQDICSRNQICLNGGHCIQVSQQPGYKCRCEGTKHFGNRCQRSCSGFDPSTGKYPHECIEI